MPRFNYFKTVELKYKYQLSKKNPIVVRFDGKNITKSKQYDISQKNQFSINLIETTKRIVKEFNHCIAYVAMDEVNFIFQEPKEFFDYYTDNSDSLQYCLSIFQQHFLSIFWKEMPNIFFGVSMFNIPKDKINSYIAYRKTSAYNVAITYFAKRHLEKSKYVNKKQVEILNEIKQKKLYSLFSAYKHFVEGTLINDEYFVKMEKDFIFDF